MTQAAFARITDCRFERSVYTVSQLPSDSLPQVAFAGRSNVGKSSLLNKLVGRKHLAKTSSTPGKTRSINFYLVNNRFYLVDLPGYGYAKAPASMRKEWGRLIEEYFERSGNLKGLVLLIDCRRDPTEDDLQLLSWLSARRLPAVVVLTKADKLSRHKLNSKVKTVEHSLDLSVIPFSVVSGEGKNELLKAIAHLLGEWQK
jgi:GTP-binding protein